MSAVSRSDVLVVTAKSGKVFELTPVLLKRVKFPSQNASLWLRFQGTHLVDGALHESEMNRVQAFMRKHETEALTDGKTNLTIAGSGLAICYPEVCNA